jgi:Uma2 family endonuclease
MPVLTETEYELEQRQLPAEFPDRFEVIDGEFVGLEYGGVYSSVVANILCDELTFHGRMNGLGRARMGMLYPIPTLMDPGRLRRPDVAYTTFKRWPLKLPINFIGDSAPVVPDLVVKVVCPNDPSDDVISPTNEYLRAGVRVVWVIHPGQRQLLAFTADEAVRKYSEKDELDGGEVLPGFRFPMASLFPARAETKP